MKEYPFLGHYEKESHGDGHGYEGDRDYGGEETGSEDVAREFGFRADPTRLCEVTLEAEDDDGYHAG